MINGEVLAGTIKGLKIISKQKQNVIISDFFNNARNNNLDNNYIEIENNNDNILEYHHNNNIINDDNIINDNNNVDINDNNNVNDNDNDNNIFDDDNDIINDNNDNDINDDNNNSEEIDNHNNKIENNNNLEDYQQVDNLEIGDDDHIYYEQDDKKYDYNDVEDLFYWVEENDIEEVDINNHNIDIHPFVKLTLNNYENFNINDSVMELISKTFENKNENKDFIDENLPLYRFDTVTSPNSGKYFTDSLSSIFAKNCISPSIVDSIMNELSDQIPILNIPYKYCRLKQTKKFYLPKNNSNVKVLPIKVHTLDFDVCRNSCMVFVNSKDMVCNKCLAPRYKFCKKCYEICGSYIYDCTDHSINKVAIRSIKYRSIKLLIIELMQYQSFRDLIQYSHKRSDNDKYYSISEGASYKSHVNEMNENFNQFVKQSGKKDCIQISLTFSWFYDAVKLFGKLLANFSPVLVTCTSLPPNIRNIIGIGTFLISYFTSKKKSEVETFLLEKCFLDEFNGLGYGFEMEIDNQIYFIQARLIMHLFDLAQLHPMINVQAQQSSKAGCAGCNLGKGTTIPLRMGRRTGIVKYGCDIRQALPISHVLRFSGISRNDKSDDETVIPMGPNDGNYGVRQIDHRIMKLYKHYQPRYDALKLFLTDKGRQSYSFFHNDLADYKIFDDYLFYESCWLGPFISHKSTTTQDMLRRQQHRKDNNLKHYKTVLGEGILFTYRHFNYKSDSRPEFYHVLKGFLNDVMFRKVIANPIQKPLLPTNVKDYYEKLDLDMFPELLNSNFPKCSMKNNEKCIAQGFLKCVLVPTNCSSKLIICNGDIFDRPGEIEIADIVTIFTVYLNLILMCSTNILPVYKTYYRFLGCLINRLRNPEPWKADVKPLKFRIIEFQALTVGLFPVIVLTYMLHALLDVAEGIKDHGPTTESHGLCGERGVGQAKRMVKIRGGTKFEQMAYKKSYQKEQDTLETFYSSFYDNMEKKDVTSPLELGDNGKVVYNSRINCLSTHYEKHIVKIDAYEFEKIDSLIQQQILKKYHNNENQCIISSSYYRAMYFINRFKMAGETLYECTKRIVRDFQTLENDNLIDILTNMQKKPSNEEIDKIIKFIRKKQNISESLSDCIFRIHSTHDYLKRSSITYECIEYFYRSIHSSLADSMINHIGYCIYEQVNENQLIKMYREGNKILSDDYLTLRYIVETMINKVSISKYAIINGVKQYGRGFHCSEKSTNVTNENNNIVKNWFYKSHYSSWCKIRNDVYGQLNFFFSLNIPTDSFVSKLLIASASCRKACIPLRQTTIYPSANLEMNYIECKNSKLISDTFFVFDDILPTRVATIAFKKLKRGLLRYFAPIYTQDEISIEMDVLIKRRYVVKNNNKETVLDFLGSFFLIFLF